MNAKSTSNVAKAFAPANISLIFSVHKHKNPRWMGSTGIGLTLNKGVIVEASCVQKKSSQVFFNHKKINFKTVETVISTLTKESVSVDIISDFPLGAGFGISGASALATSYALNKLLKLKKTKKELAIIAHIAEIKNKTGLGDVTNQYFGGFFLKTKPSSYFKVINISLLGLPVYWSYIGKISTKKILESLGISKINKAATRQLRRVQSLINNKQIELSEIFDIAYEFSYSSGLLRNKKVIQQVNKIKKNNGHASMIMLGNAVISDKKFKGSKKIIISNKKAQVL